MYKRIILFTFTLLLFAGSVGIPMFIHACEEDGVFYSYLVQSESHCKENNENDFPPCCESKKKENKDCCNDETTILQLKLDYATTWNEFHFCIYTYTLVCSKIFRQDFIFSQTKEKNANYCNGPPPKPWGKTLLIHQQIFLI